MSVVLTTDPQAMLEALGENALDNKTMSARLNDGLDGQFALAPDGIREPEHENFQLDGQIMEKFAIDLPEPPKPLPDLKADFMDVRGELYMEPEVPELSQEWEQQFQFFPGLGN